MTVLCCCCGVLVFIVVLALVVIGACYCIPELPGFTIVYLFLLGLEDQARRWPFLNVIVHEMILKQFLFQLSLFVSQSKKGFSSHTYTWMSLLWKFNNRMRGVWLPFELKSIKEFQRKGDGGLIVDMAFSLIICQDTPWFEPLLQYSRLHSLEVGWLVCCQ